jgi:hypothetical protein
MLSEIGQFFSFFCLGIFLWSLLKTIILIYSFKKDDFKPKKGEMLIALIWLITASYLYAYYV